jgi:hypothetical protein
LLTGLPDPATIIIARLDLLSGVTVLPRLDPAILTLRGCFSVRTFR